METIPAVLLKLALLMEIKMLWGGKEVGFGTVMVGQYFLLGA
jgi:hypothetical protein